jgi:hypothetical protein
MFATDTIAVPAPLLIGEVYRFAFQRTRRGWRITGLASTRTWSLTQSSGQGSRRDACVSR